MDCAQCERIGATGDWHQGVRVFHHHDTEVTQDQGFKLAAARLYDEQLHILLEKNISYSPLNISQAPFGVLEGLVTRISDKFWRAVNLVENPGNTRYESLEDTFGDLMNYAAIAILCMRGEWPGVPKLDKE